MGPLDPMWPSMLGHHIHVVNCLFLSFAILHIKEKSERDWILRTVHPNLTALVKWKNAEAHLKVVTQLAFPKYNGTEEKENLIGFFFKIGVSVASATLYITWAQEWNLKKTSPWLDIPHTTLSCCSNRLYNFFCIYSLINPIVAQV